jgi:hypothetical protein
MGKYSATVEDHLVLPALVHLPEAEVFARGRSGQSVPAPVSIRLLIDTGSRRSTIIPGIIRHLDPPGGNPVRVATSLAARTTRLFWVRLSFPDSGLASFDPVQVASLAMPPELAHFHGLLGRDLLQRLDAFLYEGRRGRYTLRDKPGLLSWLRCRL